MARARTHTFWIERINQYGRNQRKLKSPAIRRHLQDQMRRGELQPPAEAGVVPSAKTISRALIEFHGKPESEQRQYEWFSWPQCMLAGLLPWEASRALLDLLQYCQELSEKHVKNCLEHGVKPPEYPAPPPTIQQAEWFWRITLAAPDAPIGYRWECAMEFARDSTGVIAKVMVAKLAAKGWLPVPPPPPLDFSEKSPTEEVQQQDIKPVEELPFGLKLSDGQVLKIMQAGIPPEIKAEFAAIVAGRKPRAPEERKQRKGTKKSAIKGSDKHGR